jgi:hypothetical protein
MLVFFSIKHDENFNVWRVFSNVKHDHISTEPIGEFSYQDSDKEESYLTALNFGQKWVYDFAIEHDCFVRDPVLVS